MWGCSGSYLEAWFSLYEGSISAYNHIPLRCSCTYVCYDIYIYTHVMFTLICICICMYVYMYMYMYMYLHMFIHIYIGIYLHV